MRRIMLHLLFFLMLTIGVSAAQTAAPASAGVILPNYDYRVLATSRTSTMEKEMNEAADAGYQFTAVMGGETSAGGKEVVVVMAKQMGSESHPKKKYKLLATSRTSTMQ